MSQGSNRRRLVAVTLDETSIGRSTPDIEHERAVAIYDLLEDNSFHPRGHEGGPYELALSITSNRLVFDIKLADGSPVVAHHLSLSPLRRIVKDYFLICDSYYAAIRTASPASTVPISQRCTNSQVGRVPRNNAIDPAASAMAALTLTLIAVWMNPSASDCVSTLP